MAFEDWIATGGVLWIRGKAGSGKSVLAKTILKHLAERLGADAGQMSSWLVCDWFYNARGTETGISHSSMLRSLAYEILRHDEKTYECAKNHYRPLISGVGHSNWTLSELISLIHDLAASPSTTKTVTIVDALDESENGDDGTPENRLSIVRSLCEIAVQSLGQMRIIILSRPDPLIESHMRHCHRINMQEHNHEDIEALVEPGLDSIREAWASICGFSNVEQLFVTSSGEPSQNKETHFGLLRKIPRPPRETEPLRSHQLAKPIRLLDEQEQELQKIKGYLIMNASGVVLWVCLVIQELLDCVQSTEKAFTLKSLTETLYRLPGDLYDLYAHMILGLNPTQDSQKTTTTKKIMMWVIGSAPWGPLTLKHLWEALALPEEPSSNCEWSRGSISRGRFEIGQNWDRFCQIIHQHCGPLIETSGDHSKSLRFTYAARSVFSCDTALKPPRSHVQARDTSTVHLLHQTTKTFLEIQERSGQLHINSELASILVLNSCYLYLGLKPPQPDEYVFRNNLRKKEFLRKSTLTLLKFRAITLIDYARDRPLYDFAVRVLQDYLPFQRFSIMESIQGGDGSHDLRDCFVVYCVLDAFQTGDVTMSEAHDIRSFFCQCCLRGGVDMLATFFNLLQKYQYPKSRPRVSIRCAYEVLRGATEALLQLERSSFPQTRCLWHPTLQTLVECYSRRAMAVDNTSTAAMDARNLDDVDEPIDMGLDFLESIQKRCQECPPHTSHGHTSTADQSIIIHGESVTISIGRVYESISQVIAWLDLASEYVVAPHDELSSVGMTPPLSQKPGTPSKDFLQGFNKCSPVSTDSSSVPVSGLYSCRDLTWPPVGENMYSSADVNLGEMPQNVDSDSILQDLEPLLAGAGRGIQDWYE